MKCIALLDSGNYAFFLASVLAEKGITLEVVPAPCSIAVNGCGFCIEFPARYLDQVINESKKHKMPLRKIFAVEQSGNKERYKILPDRTNPRLNENN
jgi:hypothetical protein